MDDGGSGSGPCRGPFGRAIDALRQLWPRRDSGVGQAIEAMLLGALIVGAIGFAIASKAPPPPSEASGSQGLEEKTWDAVEALDRMHYPDEAYGNSTLSKVVADAAAGDEDPLVDSLREFMPVGSQFQVYLNNGYDRIPLYDNRTPGGQTVGVAYPFEPNWRDHYGRTDLRIYNANLSSIAMGTNLAPIFNSNLVQDEGERVRASVAGELDWSPGLADPAELADELDAVSDWQASPDTSFEEDVYATLIQGNDTHSYPSASVYMQCQRDTQHVPCYATDLTETMTGYGPVEQAEVNSNVVASNLRVVTENNGPGDLPADTTLTFDLPVGLEAEESRMESPDGTFDNATITVDGSAPQPQTVTVELNTTLSQGEEATFDLWVNRTDDRYAYKHVHADLAEGAASTSQFLVRVEEKADYSYTGGDERVAMVSTPRPAGSGDTPTGRWGLVLPTPIGNTTIDEAHLELTEGSGAIEAVDFPSDFDPSYPTTKNVTDGTLTVNDDGNEVEWSISGDGVKLDGYEFVEFQFQVDTDGTFTRAAPTFPANEPYTEFTGFEPPPNHIQTEPGIWWIQHPPDEGSDLPGYGASGSDPEADDPVKEHDATNLLTHRNQKLEGTTTYRLADFGNTKAGKTDGQLQGAIQDATHAANIDATPQRATPGDDVVLNIDSRDLALFMSQYTGANSLNMTTYVYAPWGIRNLTADETFDHEVAAAVTNDPTLLHPGRFNDDDAQDLIVGSTDGTLYALDGETGEVFTGGTYPLPGAEDATDTAEPNQLTATATGGGARIYGVGTTAGLDEWFSVDAELDERWTAEKPEGRTATSALNASMDLTGDGVPEFVSASGLANSNHPFGDSRLTVFEGADADGDGTTAVHEGWGNESGQVLVNGTPKNVGFANVGSRAEGGVYAATGLYAGSNLLFNKTTDPRELADQIIDTATDPPDEITLGVKDSGLVGLNGDGTPAWNLTGGRFGDLERTDAMDLGTGPSGNPWHGILGAGGDGWVHGLNSSRARTPVDGWTWLGTHEWDDVAFSNALEGYWTGAKDRMYATRDGGTTFVYRSGALEANAVDTPDGAPFAGPGSASWWAGDAGQLYRSPDRLETLDALSTSATIVKTVTADQDLGGLVDSLGDDSLDLTKVDFHDVHAISSEEAWFVGEGRDDSTLSKYGYILHVREAGEVMHAYEVECVENDDVLSGCALRGVDRANNRLWVVGDYGTVLTQDLSRDAEKVDLVGSDGINGNGALAIDVNARETVKIQNVTVDWTPNDRLDWMRGVTLNTDSGNPDLWNKTDGEPYMADSSKHSDKGAARDALLYVDDYVNNVDGSSDSDRVLSGEAAVTVGPFRNDTEPDSNDPDAYFGRSYYSPTDGGYPRPMNITVNVTYEDDSWDHLRVWLVEGGSVRAWEHTARHWAVPSNAGMTTPATCFGPPDDDCNTYHSINASTVHPDGLAIAVSGVSQADGTITVGPDNTTSTSKGEDQAPLVRLPPGSTTFEKVWSPEINQTLRDVAVNVENPDQWLVVGEGPLAARSYDAGENWTVLPTLAMHGEGEGGRLTAVDATHPTAPLMVGGGTGDGEALQWWAGGYRESGHAITKDLYDPGDDSTLDRVDFENDDLVISDTGTALSSWAELHLWDPNLDDGSGDWVTVYNRSDEWRGNASAWDPHYNFTSGGSDTLKVKFTLDTKTGFTPQSPSFRGHLNFSASTDGTSKDTTLDVSESLDLNDTADFDAESLETLDQDPDIGALRLTALQNPWIHKLGNYDEGDWSAKGSPTRGAHPLDMDLAPDGETLFVGTGGIYDALTAPHGTSHGDDNSLYAINATTGRRAEAWDTLHFDEPVQLVDAGRDTVYVMTGQRSADRVGDEVDWGPLKGPTAWMVNRSTGEKEYSDPYDGNITSPGIALYDGFPQETDAREDLALMLEEDDGSGDGRIDARRAPSFERAWSQNPSVEGQFEVTYNVPRSAMYGAHLVVTEVNWTTTDDFGNDILQSARIHNAFSVTPPSKNVPLSPTYNLEVVAWMEDW